MRRSPLLGYNHNVRCGDVVYHVQTEDSGLAYLHVATHVYLSGEIVASRRFSYAETDEDAVITRSMQVQHKEMLVLASQGRFQTPPPVPPVVASKGAPWHETSEGVVWHT